jgi:ferredoxin-NADP reductase
MVRAAQREESMIEKGAAPPVRALRRRLLAAGRALTTPLLPDDYLKLVNPLWSTRELKGTIVKVVRETPNAATVVIRPGGGWPGHRAGQYLRIGVEINGIRHWRAYTITSDPAPPGGVLSISVRRVDGGRMSPFFTSEVTPGTIVFLGEVEGTFCIPDPLPGKLLMVSAGSGVTPIFAMLRALERDGAMRDVVHFHCERRSEDVMFAAPFAEMSERNRGYRRIEHLSSIDGRLSTEQMQTLCPDWRERSTFLSGPPQMLRDFTALWDQHEIRERLALEHFQPFAADGGALGLGRGGTVHFRVTGVDAACDGATAILVGAERAGATLPFGCRMGICHQCIGRLAHGRVRDLRTGALHGEAGEMIRTCINAPEGHVEIEL